MPANQFPSQTKTTDCLLTAGALKGTKSLYEVPCYLKTCARVELWDTYTCYHGNYSAFSVPCGKLNVLKPYSQKSKGSDPESTLHAQGDPKSQFPNLQHGDKITHLEVLGESSQALCVKHLATGRRAEGCVVVIVIAVTNYCTERRKVLGRRH